MTQCCRLSLVLSGHRRVSRVIVSASLRLASLALWVTPFDKTILNRFICTNPAGGAREVGFSSLFFCFALASTSGNRLNSQCLLCKLTVNLLFVGRTRRMTQCCRLSLVLSGHRRVSRVIVSASLRLASLALWVTPFDKTILNRFICTNPAGGARKKHLLRQVLFSIKSVLTDGINPSSMGEITS